MASFREFLYRVLNSGQLPPTQNALATPAAPEPAAPNALAGLAVGQPQMPMRRLAGAEDRSPAPMAQIAPQGGSVAPQGGSGGNAGGIGNFLGDMLMPQRSGRNRTVSWLQEQGLDEGTATLLAGNKGALQTYLLDRSKGNRPEYDFMNVDGQLLRTDNFGNVTPMGQFGSSDEARPMTPTERLQWGIPQNDERPYAMTSDGPKLIGGGGVNVNLPGEPTIGTVPAGWAATQDPETGQWSMAPIAGGPAAEAAQAAEAARASAGESKERYGNIVLQDIGRMKEVVENAPWYSPATGLGAGWLKERGGTNAADAAALADTIKANIGFDRLQKMREESPTGGALGQVTERELQFLQSVLGSIEQSQSEEQLLANLERLDEVYRSILTKASAYPNAAAHGFDGVPSPQDTSSEGGATPPSSYTGDPALWEFMTPEDRKLWQ